MLKVRLLCDEVCKKLYVAASLIFLNSLLEPILVVTEIEVDNSVDVGAEKRFKNELTLILIFGVIFIESLHVKNFDSRTIFNDLSKQTKHQNSSCLFKFVHFTKLEV